MLNRRLWMLVSLILALLSFGTFGYRLLEGWSWHDAIFMTVITLSTVGYGEVQPLSAAGERFTILLILAGVSSLAYTFTTLTDYVVAGELNGFLRRRRMTRTINRLDGHYIICGYGRVGRQVCQELRRSGHLVVVIDNNPESRNELEMTGINHIVGDATADDILKQAGIEQAAGLCTCLPSDASNVFIILSARTLKRDLAIISRCNVEENQHKLRIAGADHVLNPYLITGHRMAAQLLHPNIVEFLDVIMRRGDLELIVEEVQISPTSSICQRTLAESHIRNETGVNILAIRRATGQLLADLTPQVVLQPGDTLIGLGTHQQLSELARLAA